MPVKKRHKKRTAITVVRGSATRKLRPVHFHISLAVVIMLGVGVTAIMSASNDQDVLAGPPTAPSGQSWQEVWSDEFNGSSLDSSKWNVDNNTNYGASNKEDECYRANNVGVSGGSLRLTAVRETVSCGATNPDTGNSTYYFTSGLVTTRAQSGPMKYKFKQGYIEARVKAPKGNPYWPAFWLVGPNDGSTPGWPDYGEFDIFELYGARPDITNGVLHYSCTSSGNHCKTAPSWYNIKTDSAYGGSSTLGTHITDQAGMDAYSGGTTDFQVYGFLWEANRLSWYVNGRKYRFFDGTNVYRIEQNGSQTFEASTSTLGTPDIPFSTVFNYEHSIILNLAVGGLGPQYSYYGYTVQDTAGGYNNGNYVAVSPGTMEIDYVRVYQLGTTPTPPPPAPSQPPSSPPPTPTPTPPPPSSGGSQSGGTPEVVVTSSGEEVTVAKDNQTITGNAVLSPELATDPAEKAKVLKVEYYIDGKLKAIVRKPPFQFDTSKLTNGTYKLTEKIYYKDGTTKQKSVAIQVANYQRAGQSIAKKAALPATLTAGAGGLLLVVPFTRRLIVRVVSKLLTRLLNRW
jgi:beta-glucanase (GH16 family)